MRPVLAAGLLAGLALTAGPAAACRQALALGLDVSGSVDAVEYRLQTAGLAAALMAPEVRAAILAGRGRPVALAVYLWSGTGDQQVILPWTELTGPAALEAAAARLAAAPRPRSQSMTAVGAAMAFGMELLARRPDCGRLTLDLSADGMNNAGWPPLRIAAEAGGRAVTVNALVIGDPDDRQPPAFEPPLEELARWFAAEVVRGPGAFVERAESYGDYARAMRRKLLREIEAPLALDRWPRRG